MRRINLLVRGLAASGALGLRAAWLRRRRSDRLVLLAYHRVLDRISEDFTLDRAVVSCTTEEFAREMGFVAREFDCVSFADLADGTADRARRPLIVTFDDGYRDNHDIAWPVLRRHGLKATFFVSTGYLDGRRPFWWDEIAQLLGRAPAGELDAGAWGAGRLPLGTGAQRAAATAALLRVSKLVKEPDRAALLEHLRRQCGAVDRPAAADETLMTWDQVRALAAGGMEIGSHTVTHPVLANLPDDGSLARELGESKQRIEAQIGRPVTALSYPVGRASGVTDGVVAAVEAAGYRHACVYEHGTNPRTGYDAYRLRRIKAEVGTDFARFRAKVLCPGLVRY